MIFHILTLFPGAFDGYLQSSMVARAIARGLVQLHLTDFREHAEDRHRTCDDAPYGGGPGMLLKPGPLFNALDGLRARGKRVLLPTPSGQLMTQSYARRLACLSELVIICGHYEGVDQRVTDRYVTDEMSIGDYVVFSGEVAAMVIVEAVTRLLKGAIREASVENESFSRGLLEYPQYTRPEVIRGMNVPSILLSGHHEKIERWRLERSIEKTWANRPEMLTEERLSSGTWRVVEEMGVKTTPPEKTCGRGAEINGHHQGY